MGMVVRTNTMALNAYRSLSANQNAVSKSLEKLSSGFRINRAGDDASGLSISEKMKAQIKGLEQASANAQDGISLVQTAEGALTEVHSMLNRMVELATKSANGTIQNEVDREAIQTEVDALKTEITRIAKSTNFNGIQLLDGSLSGASAPTVKAVLGGETLSGKANAAVAFTATYAVGASDTAIHLEFKDVDGNDVTLSATGLTAPATGADALAALEAADADKYAKLVAAYDITANAANITFTAKTPGANGSVKAGAAAAATIGGATAGVNANTTVTLNKAMAVGDTITIGGKTYKMAAATNAEKNEFADLAGLQALATANGYNVTGADLSAGTTLTFTALKQGSGLTLQVGDTNEDFNHVTVSIDDLTADGLGIADLRVSDRESAGAAIQTIKDAINKVSTNRGNLGALQNRLEHTINNLDATSENMQAANSRIRDTDMAKEMMAYTKQNILTQAAQAMLAQANQQPQAILQLLQ
jgi:flagellin